MLWCVFRSNCYTYNTKIISQKRSYSEENIQWPKYQWKYYLHWLSCIQIWKKCMFSVLEINHFNIDVQNCPPIPQVLWYIKKSKIIFQPMKILNLRKWYQLLYNKSLTINIRGVRPVSPQRHLHPPPPKILQKPMALGPCSIPGHIIFSPELKGGAVTGLALT